MSTIKTVNVIHPSGVTNNIVTDDSGNVAVGGALTVGGVAAVAVAPGTSGNLLTSNGTVWTSTAPTGIPSQTGNAGKLLSTNGTSTSWSTDSVVRARGSLSALTTSPAVGSGAVNIASVTAGTTGVYTVTFSTALPNTDYQVLATIRQTSGVNDNVVFCTTKNTGSFVLSCFRGSTAAAAGTIAIDVVVYGGW
jgi:hypothetical protein